MFPIIRAVCKPLLLFLHAPITSPTMTRKKINAAKLNPTSKIFNKKRNGFSCFKSFQNTLQRKIESKSSGSTSNLRGARFIKFVSFANLNFLFALLSPAASFLLMHAYFCVLKIILPQIFGPEAENHAPKNRQFTRRFRARETRSRQNASEKAREGKLFGGIDVVGREII